MLIELSTEVIIGSEVSEVIAVNFLARIDAFPDDEHDIDHVFRPGRIIMVAINENILEGVELPAGSFLHTEGDLIVDVVIQVIESAHGFVYLVSEEDCGLEDGLDVGVEVRETLTALFCLAMRVYEEDQHASIYYYWGFRIRMGGDYDGEEEMEG
jgi:hypothetical protein